MYIRQPSLLQVLIWASYRHFKKRLPEATCCCLHVDVVLVVMYCMYILAFIVTSAEKSKLWVYLNFLRLFVVVYKLALFMECCLHCSAYVTKLSWSLVLTPASYRYI